jgi:hypothetical protein
MMARRSREATHSRAFEAALYAHYRRLLNLADFQFGPLGHPRPSPVLENARHDNPYKGMAPGITIERLCVLVTERMV